MNEILAAAELIDDDFGLKTGVALRDDPERCEAIRSRIFDNLTQDEDVLMSFFDSRESSPTAYEMLVRLHRTPFAAELSERFPALMQKLDEASRPYVEWAKGKPDALRKPRGWLATARPTFKEAAAYFDLDPRKLDREAYWQRSEARRNGAGDDVRTLLEVIRHGPVIDDAIRSPRPELSQREASEINSILDAYSPGL